MSRLFSILMLFIFLSSLFAEDKYSCERISVTQGLPNSQITQVYFGINGLMWIGTGNGLCIYDGYNFIVKQSEAFDTNTLADDHILRITQDINGNIWLLTQYGIEFYNIYNNSVHKVLHIHDVSEVIDFTVSSYNGKVYVINRKSVFSIDNTSFNIDTIASLNEHKSTSTLIKNHNFYLFSHTGFKKYDLENQSVESVKYENSPGNISNVVKTQYNDTIICTSSNQLFTFSISKGVFTRIFSGKGDIVRLTNLINGKLGILTKDQVYQLHLTKDLDLISSTTVFNIGDSKIIHLAQDSDNLIWLASNSGIVKINPHSRHLKHLQYNEAFLKDNVVNKVIRETTNSGYLVKDKRGRWRFISPSDNRYYQLPSYNYVAACLIRNKLILGNEDNGAITYDIASGAEEQIYTFNNHSIHNINVIEDEIWISTDKGVYINKGTGYSKVYDIVIDDFIVMDDNIYFTSDKGFGKFSFKDSTSRIFFTENNRMEHVHIFEILQSFDGKIWLATNYGLYRFNSSEMGDQDKLFTLIYKGKVYSLIEAKELPEVWFASDLGIGTIDYQANRIMFLGYEDGVRQTSFIPGGVYFGKKGELNFMAQREILSFMPEQIFRNQKSPEVQVIKVDYMKEERTTSKLFPESDTIFLASGIKFIQLAFTTLDYFAPLQTTFVFSLSGIGEKERWETVDGNIIPVGGLPQGSYNLLVRATNSHGVESDNTKKILIVVKAPLVQSKIAFLGYAIILVIVILLLINLRTRNLRRINREYKEKEQIAKKIEQQKEELTLKNKNITDSINYARRIQLAMMPSVRLFKTLFTDSFILHMPKDIVSGDFYWVNHVENKIFVSSVDCTGHGVPGAFMSIIGVELFRRITEIEKISTPAEVLNSLSKNFERVFGDVDKMKLRDGMDLAFCSLNEEHTILEYAGAFNPLYIIRDSSIMEIKGDRHSVGIYEEEEVRSFNNHVIPIQDGDSIYIFTDGFVDQFGGPKGKKYKYRRFRHLLLALHQLPMQQQEEFLRKSILEWKGDLDQVDDILVMGIRISHQ